MKKIEKFRKMSIEQMAQFICEMFGDKAIPCGVCRIETCPFVEYLGQEYDGECEQSFDYSEEYNL